MPHFNGLHLKRLGAMIGVGLFVLIGCVIVTPTPTSPTSPSGTPTHTLNDFVIALAGRSTGYSTSERDVACEDIIPFNGEQAFKNTGGNSPIFWTFGVNFNSQSSQGNPLGCYKLYEVDSNRTPPAYVPIRGTEYSYLVDTCTRAGATLITLSSGQANFDGTGYVECAMNLDEWMHQVSIRTTDQKLQSLLQTFYIQQIHEYQSFTMVARASLPQSIVIPTPSPWPTDFPLIFYAGSPQGQLTSTPVDQPLLALVPIESSQVHFGTCTLSSLASTPVQGYYWWYDVRIAPTNAYVYSPDYNPALATKPTVVNCGAGNAASPVRLWAQEAKLYIGYDPDTGNVFQGSIDGLLIDPPDSKPPE